MNERTLICPWCGGIERGLNGALWPLVAPCDQCWILAGGTVCEDDTEEENQTDPETETERRECAATEAESL